MEKNHEMRSERGPDIEDFIASMRAQAEKAQQTFIEHDAKSMPKLRAAMVQAVYDFFQGFER